MNNLRLAALLTFSLVSSVAFAHIEPGIYNGNDQAGAPCAIEAVRQFYVDDVRHPLNERIVLKAGELEFTVGHPAKVEAATDTAYFDHDHFEGVKAMSFGAMALVIDMIHEGGNEGPAAFHLIRHDWKLSQKSAVHCTGLRRAQ